MHVIASAQRSNLDGQSVPGSRLLRRCAPRNDNLADRVDATGAGERTGHPLGSAAFTTRLERRLGRRKPGPKPADHRRGEGHTDLD